MVNARGAAGSRAGLEVRVTRRDVRPAVVLALLSLVLTTGNKACENRPAGPAVAPQAPALSALEAGVVDVLNFVRADPPGYAAALRETRSHYEGLLYRLSLHEMLQTEEGVAALDEAVAVLEATQPLPHLDVALPLCLAARDHAVDQSATGAVGHDGSDGSSFGERIERHATWSGRIGENISYGRGTAGEVVSRLVVDDGVPSRGHRTTILNGAFRVVGVACEPHPRFETVCVVEFASEVKPIDRQGSTGRKGS